MFIPFLNLGGADDDAQRLLTSTSQEPRPEILPAGHTGVAPAYAGARGLGSSLVCSLDCDEDGFHVCAGQQVHAATYEALCAEIDAAIEESE